MKVKYKKLLTALVCIFVLIICISVSYAAYENKKNENATLVLTDEYLSINYLDGKSFDYYQMKSGDTYTKRISVTNVSNVNTYLTISLMDVDKTSDNLKLTVLDSEKNILYDKYVTNIDTELIKGVDLAPGKTLSYVLMVKNEGNESTKFYANILAYKEIIKQQNKTFKDIILENSEVKDIDSYMGNVIAENDEGLVKTSDDDGETYIFRGNVLNNNVNFANFDWKIVRINGDSTIRLILNSALDNQVPYNDNVEETDNYSEKLEYDNSKVKEELEKFMTSNLQENSKYIVETNFCEDTSVFNTEDNVTYLNPYNRSFVDNSPTLSCMGNNKKEKIGLLTVDEIILAGAHQKSSNSNYYLYNGSINGPWWTMSGSQILENSNAVDAISVNKDGSLSFERKISTPLYVRPVINLDANTSVNGKGTVDDPYIIKQ